MALQLNNCDQLLSFVAQTTNGIQEAFLKKRKGKHVNPRKFIQKRLNRGSKPVRPQSKPAKQAAPSAPTNLDRHCVAPGVFPTMGAPCSWNQTSIPSAAPSPSPSYNCFTSYGYPKTTTAITPSNYSDICTYSRPSSCQDEIDPELESLLSEFGLESPPSQYTGSPSSSAVSRSGSGVGFLPSSTSFDAILGTDLLSSEQQYPFSPRSDYSDIDDSAYSSPLNSSPACPAYYQQHMSSIASCEWLPICSSTAAQPAVRFTLPVDVPSHREIIDMLATPTQ